MSLVKKFAIAAALAAPLALAACGTPTTALCPDDGAGIGHTTIAQVFEGAAQQKVCHIRGAELAPDGRYAMDDGALVIDGNIPDGARISVENGKIFVNGDVGADVRLSAKVPETQESYTTLMPIMVGKTMILMPVTNYRFDDYTFNADHQAAITIAGNIGADARITTNHGLAIDGNIGKNVDIYHTRDTEAAIVQTGPIARTAAQHALTM